MQPSLSKILWRGSCVCFHAMLSSIEWYSMKNLGWADEIVNEDARGLLEDVTQN